MFRKRKNTLSFHQKKKVLTPKLIKEIISWITITIFAVILAFGFNFAFGMQVKVIGDSMEPSAYNGQPVLINKIIYIVSGPKKGDIIAFLPNGNANSHYYVKRVVGTPGDKIQIIDGSLYVNGKLQDKENDIYDKMEDAGIAANEIKLGSGEYFVLGDNRNSSEDSRSANIGVVKTNMMLGKVWFKLGTTDHKGGFVLK
jgi:signal peptidase I